MEVEGSTCELLFYICNNWKINYHKVFGVDAVRKLEVILNFTDDRMAKGSLVRAL